MSEYTRPEVRTIQSDEILEVLGPVSAGSPGFAAIGEPDPSPGGPKKGKKH